MLRVTNDISNVISLTLRSPIHPLNAPLECSEWHRKRRNKAVTKAGTTVASSFVGTFLDYCCFRKFRYFIKLHLHKAARSMKI